MTLVDKNSNTWDESVLKESYLTFDPLNSLSLSHNRDLPKGYAIVPFDSWIREGDLFYNPLDIEGMNIDPSCFGKMVSEFSPSVIVILRPT